MCALWDVLRPLADAAGTIEPITVWVLAIVAAALVGIAFLAYKKAKSKKLLFVLIAFGLFFIKAVLGVLDVYYSPGVFMNFSVQGAFDVAILVALFIALFKK